MINRRQLQCISCGTKIVTRTGIGHGNVQKHKFACPKCGIEIGFVLNLDQKAVTLDYEKPKNANWIDSDEESSLTVLFYPELMIPKNLTYPISPFIVTVGNYKNIQEYQSAEAVRRHIKDEIWPILQRVYIHFENKNLDLLKKDGTQITKNFPSLKDDEERGKTMRSVLVGLSQSPGIILIFLLQI